MYETGYNSGLPFVAAKLPDAAGVLDIARLIEELLTEVARMGGSLPVLIDPKNDFLEIRYATTPEEQKMVEQALLR